MRTTNITNLRTNLSRILEAVRKGEEVEILDRNVPVARLVPVTPATGGGKGRLPPWLEQLRRSGAVRVGSLKPFPEILKGFPPGTPMLGNVGVEAILEERREGR